MYNDDSVCVYKSGTYDNTGTSYVVNHFTANNALMVTTIFYRKLFIHELNCFGPFRVNDDLLSLRFITVGKDPATPWENLDAFFAAVDEYYNHE